MKYLYRYETKGIQNWILSSNKLRDLAGGSALVEALTQAADEAAKKLDATVIQATSGAMTAEFPDREKLQAFASEWPIQVAFRAPGLQLVQGWVPESEGLPALFKELAARRNMPPLNDLETNPWVLRAGLSGLPAVPSRSRAKARQTTQDQISLAKEWALHKEHYGKELPVTGGPDWDDFEQELDRWPEGPVAIVHADGTGVGQRLMKIKGSDNLQCFSKAMKKASSTAIKVAVQEVTRDRESGHLLARPVVSAGDDLTYILLAGDARRFTEAWLKAFERETAAQAGDLGGDGGLYGGAGIVMVHRGYPFSRAYRLAEELCKKAKDKVKASTQPNRSVLAFKRVTNSLVDEIAEDAIGWIVSDQNQLGDLVDVVRDLPRGTLRTWLDHFQRPNGSKQTQRLWDRAKEVADNKVWEGFERALQAAGADPATGALEPGNSGPSLPLGKGQTTPISNALTLRFVERTPAHV
ncbi:MAG: hypothetical protein WC314_14745 [Vulcanimicrobiota bacterium]